MGLKPLPAIPYRDAGLPSSPNYRDHAQLLPAPLPVWEASARPTRPAFIQFHRLHIRAAVPIDRALGPHDTSARGYLRIPSRWMTATYR